MNAYSDFAVVYDALMNEDEYFKRADYMEQLFAHFHCKPSLVLDLACGTGRLTLELARRGFDMIGVDPSESMLSLARERSANANRNILWLCQSGQELDLFGTVNATVCTFDSINHILDEKDLAECFRRIALFTERGGLFLFDVNSEEKHRTALGDNCYILENEDVFCAWQNVTEMPYTTVILDMFSKQAGGYVRSHEEFEERAWSQEELTSMLENAGFELLARLDDLTMQDPSEYSERVQYVARRR